MAILLKTQFFSFNKKLFFETMTANVIHKILNVIISALKLSRNKYNKIKKKLLSVFL